MTLRTRAAAMRARCCACAASPRAALQESTMHAHPSAPPPRHERVPARRDPPPSTPVRHQHRERDFGIGYGNSSGYGREEHFAAPPWGPDRFRCV
jgi:hypothetical protein